MECAGVDGDDEEYDDVQDEEDEVVDHAEEVPNQWLGCGESANWTWSDGKRQHNRLCDSDTRRKCELDVAVEEFHLVRLSIAKRKRCYYVPGGWRL